MCGIAGIWNFDACPVQLDVIDRFTDSLTHRGPDGRGIWRDNTRSLALGHRRLAILDLSNDGAQPMPYANGRFWITFNGEIFNFIEIRRELVKQGCSFVSQSDTEVILAAYQTWGSSCLLRFNGMWAFAIYDQQEKSLFLARDRFGIKPLHYHFHPRRLAFASELKAFKSLADFHCQIDAETARVFLNNGFEVEGTTRTLLRGVNRLQGGHCALIRQGQIEVTRWWNTLDHLVEVPSRLDQQAEQFRELFNDAIRLRMRSDVALGTCLSGGFDSSSIVCTMAQQSRQRGERQAQGNQRAFIATFPGELNDERSKAEEVLRHAQLEGIFLPINADQALQNIDQILYSFDDLYINLPTPVWLIYRELRRCKVWVSLDGHGADELFGGYKGLDFLCFQDAPSWLRSPRQNVRRIREFLQSAHGQWHPKHYRETLRLLIRSQYLHHRDFQALRKIKRLMTRWLHSEAGPSFTRQPLENPLAGFDKVSAEDSLPSQWNDFNRELYRMFHQDTLPTILRNFDRLSMAHGVEVRMPFMDWRLVCLVMSLPASSKIGSGFTKLVAREAMRGQIPESIRSSKIKIGFGAPLHQWLGSSLKGWVAELLAHPGELSQELIDLPRLSAFVRDCSLRSSWNWTKAENTWKYLHFLWFERYFLKQ